jgi:hypothetical protein
MFIKFFITWLTIVYGENYRSLAHLQLQVLESWWSIPSSWRAQLQKGDQNRWRSPKLLVILHGSWL